MKPGRLFWKLFLGNAVLMTTVLIACIWLILHQVERFYEMELTRTLHSQAEAVSHMVADRFQNAGAAGLDRLAHEIGRDDPAGIRITFIAADGRVLGDSESDPATMESHNDRPEVVNALRHGWSEDIRFSHTLGRPMKYLAARVGPADAPAGVVRVAMAMRTIGEHWESVRRLAWSTGATGLVACILFALGLARLWSRPIRQITRTAKSLSRGDLSTRVKVSGNDEVAELADALNEMRDRLATHLATIDGQRRTLQSLLNQLGEGVIVTRPDDRIALVNPAAARLLGIREPAGQLIDKPVEACILQHQLQKMLLHSPRPDSTAAGGDATHSSVQEAQITVPGPGGPISLLARACEIALEVLDKPRSPGPAARSHLLVLTDVTPLTRMVQVKADFAANASHELRTPLSAIRGAAETLLSLDPAREPDAVRRFAEIVDRHSSRMEALVRDLLDLSRIESSAAQLEPCLVQIPPLLEELQARCADKLATRQLAWSSQVAPGTGPAMVNPHLLRLALDNLVDNAIKFTEPGGHVSVSARPLDGPDGRRIEIAVRDDGCGIPEDEQARVFERFYQVGRARSGADRGTGLGLSIVRHAVAAMDGTVRLESKPGHGTTVAVVIPVAIDRCEPGQP